MFNRSSTVALAGNGWVHGKKNKRRVGKMKKSKVKTNCKLPKTEWITDRIGEKYCSYCGQEFGKQVKEKCKYKV